MINKKINELQTLEGLIKLIEEYSPVGVEKTEPEKLRLYHDLGIYGDDADELLEAYAARFGVSLAEFRFADYFPNEGDPIPGMIWRAITDKKGKEYKQLSMSDLQKGIDCGKLK